LNLVFRGVSSEETEEQRLALRVPAAFLFVLSNPLLLFPDVYLWHLRCCVLRNPGLKARLASKKFLDTVFFLPVPLILVAFPFLTFIVSGNLQQQSNCLSTRFRGRHFPTSRPLTTPTSRVIFNSHPFFSFAQGHRQNYNRFLLPVAHLPATTHPSIAILDQDVNSAIGGGLTLNVYLLRIYPSPSFSAASPAPFHLLPAVPLAHFPITI